MSIFIGLQICKDIPAILDWGRSESTNKSVMIKDHLFGQIYSIYLSIHKSESVKIKDFKEIKVYIRIKETLLSYWTGGFQRMPIGL